MGKIINEMINTFDYYYDNEKLIKSIQFSEGKRASADEIVPQYSLQKVIRPLFGKNGFTVPSIGDHPDFNYLAGTTESIYNHIITLFLDIENSTRLNLLFSPEQVLKIKNTIICTAIEIIKAFDGHVHRIMGDAVIAFFGGRGTCESDDIINSINCAALLQYYFDKVIKQKLDFSEYPIGIRIGIDYGSQDQVLWSSYGYFNMNEVTATSFYVDVASKLQHQSGRNNIMLGHSLKSFLDLPEDILSVKKNSDGIEEKYVLPNLTNADGVAINYRKYLLNWEKYLDITMIAQEESNLIESANLGQTLDVRSSIYESDRNQFNYQYYPASHAIQKLKAIKFQVRLPYEIEYPYKIKFTVENHGDEARNLGGPNCGDHQEEYEITKLNSLDSLSHWEVTSFKGLHYMKIHIIKDGKIRKPTKFGVFIK